jgi:Family of unknown function (DUF5455)
MPLLAGLLSALFVGIAEFFAKWITRKVAVIAAGIAVYAAITGALFIGLAALVNGFVMAFPAGSAVATGVWLMIPDNGPLMVSACLAADAAVAVYRMNVQNVLFSVYAP